MGVKGSEELSDTLESINNLKIIDQSSSDTSQSGLVKDDVSDIQVTCFSEIVDDITLHFQIIRLQKQIYAWIGCYSAKLGHLYAAAPTRPSNTVSITSLIGGTSDNTGSGIARRLVIKTGLPIVLACNIPKGNPILEANVEKKLIEKLISLGYTKAKSQGSSST